MATKSGRACDATAGTETAHMQLSTWLHPVHGAGVASPRPVSLDISGAGHVVPHMDAWLRKRSSTSIQCGLRTSCDFTEFAAQSCSGQ